MTGTPKLVALTAARHASERAAATAHGEMKRGLGVLKAITTKAPLVGVMGTLLAIANSTRGYAGERSAQLAALSPYLSNALVPTELALIVALLAYCSHEYLASRLEGFDSEMRNTSLQLVNELTSAKSL